MPAAVAEILARIADHKRQELPAKRLQEAALIERAFMEKHGRRDFRAALESVRPAVIAEVKKASPSKGLLSPDFDPVRQAAAYQHGGAAALSVLTDQQFFQGSLADLRAARRTTALPVLRKDFTLEEIDIVEAAAYGADAILLIVALLNRNELERLRRLAEAYAMTALVEVHSERELDTALESGAEVIGVNNRDLHTFTVTLETSERLAARIPENILRVAESGIHERADVDRLLQAGFQAFLVGEHLMGASDPAAALRALYA